jgi:hypothetical protein
MKLLNSAIQSKIFNNSKKEIKGLYGKLYNPVDSDEDDCSLCYKLVVKLDQDFFELKKGEKYETYYLKKINDKILDLNDKKQIEEVIDVKITKF